MRSDRRLAAAVHRQHPRAWRLYLADGPHSKVITRRSSIMVGTSSELTAALALIQTLVSPSP